MKAEVLFEQKFEDEGKVEVRAEPALGCSLLKDVKRRFEPSLSSHDFSVGDQLMVMNLVSINHTSAEEAGEEVGPPLAEAKEEPKKVVRG